MHKLGVIVPYRDRDEHLKVFLPAIKQYLSRKGIEYIVILVEQDHNEPFNRGALCNIGYKEAKMNRCDYLVFHDVDMIPVNVDYSYSEHPVHLASDDLPFDSYFGGITMFPIRDFAKINGFSNKYWGWGYEDDDLMFRCINKGIDLKTKELPRFQFKDNTAIFNGVNAFAKIENRINFRKDFTINTVFSLGDIRLNADLESDRFPIFNIKGYDMELVFTSFRRVALRFFDAKSKFYEIYTDVTNEKDFDVEIKYTAKTSTIEFEVNGKTIGIEKLEAPIMNYSKEKTIFLGVDNSLTEYFAGVICNFTIQVEDATVTSLRCNAIENYKLTDISGNGNDGVLFNASIDKPNYDDTHTLYTPHRRYSILKRLKHESNGFDGGRWTSDLTRWNELRYFNEVLTGYKHPSNDGYNTVKYRINSRKKSSLRDYTKLNVQLEK